MLPTKKDIQEFVLNADKDEIVEVIKQLVEAGEAAERGLQGEYPWYIHGKASQKEAREASLNVVKTAMEKFYTAFKPFNQHR